VKNLVSNSFQCYGPSYGLCSTQTSTKLVHMKSLTLSTLSTVLCWKYMIVSVLRLTIVLTPVGVAQMNRTASPIGSKWVWLSHSLACWSGLTLALNGCVLIFILNSVLWEKSINVVPSITPLTFFEFYKFVKPVQTVGSLMNFSRFPMEKLQYFMSVCPHVTILKQLNGISWNFILWNCNTIECRISSFYWPFTDET
jgi:hypothetical protein